MGKNLDKAAKGEFSDEYKFFGDAELKISVNDHRAVYEYKLDLEKPLSTYPRLFIVFPSLIDNQSSIKHKEVKKRFASTSVSISPAQAKKFSLKGYENDQDLKKLNKSIREERIAPLNELKFNRRGGLRSIGLKPLQKDTFVFYYISYNESFYVYKRQKIMHSFRNKDPRITPVSIKRGRSTSNGFRNRSKGIFSLKGELTIEP
jgi:hypothetical protein